MSEVETMSGEDFARHVLKTNPFTQDRVTQVQVAQADVGSIHEKAFKKLVKRIEEVRAGSSATGVLLTGAAGVGKSHVLARLFRWAREEGKATVVYLHNILASPERTGQHVRKNGEDAGAPHAIGLSQAESVAGRSSARMRSMILPSLFSPLPSRPTPQ